MTASGLEVIALLVEGVLRLVLATLRGIRRLLLSSGG